MTESSKRVLAVSLISGALAVAILGGLSLQMALGNDPALGPQAKALEAARQARPAKRIIKRTVIVQETNDAVPAVQPAGGARASSGAVAPAAPAAPPPAPVVTRSS